MGRTPDSEAREGIGATSGHVLVVRGAASSARVLVLALEGLEARGKQDRGHGGDELSHQVWPLIALAYDIEDTMKQELGLAATPRTRVDAVRCAYAARGGQ